MRALVVPLLLIGCGGPSSSGGNPTDPERVLEGPFTGLRVAASPDLTGDGAPDVAISGPGIDGTGSVYVVDAGARGALGPGDASASLRSTEAYGLGEGLAACGDTDGDGAAELFVGAPFLDGGLGGAWLLDGPLSGEVDTTAATFVRALDANARGGWTVACGGDFDGDSLVDMAMAPPDADGFGIATLVGSVAFARGTPDGPEVIASLSSTFSDSHLGTEQSVVLADLDGDGLADAAVGAPGVSRVHLLFDSLAGTYDPNESGVTYDGDLDGSGSALVAGDLDGDGAQDLIVGAPGFDFDRGRVAVLLGPFGEDEALDTIDERGRWIEGQDDDERVGHALAAGDLDGDGADDLIIGGPGAVTVGPSSGVAYVLYGPASATTVAQADAVLLGGVPYANFGWSLATVPAAGGTSDILVGAPYTDVVDRIGAGAAYLFPGAVAGPTNLDAALATYVF